VNEQPEDQNEISTADWLLVAERWTLGLCNDLAHCVLEKLPPAKAVKTGDAKQP